MSIGAVGMAIIGVSAIATLAPSRYWANIKTPLACAITIGFMLIIIGVYDVYKAGL
jgi:hypothetical protein